MVKNGIIKQLSLVVMMLIAGFNTAFAQKDVELIATGDGTTKQQATLSALRSALEQTYGAIVSSNTKILNDELVKDEIVSISTGIVKKYTCLEEKELGGKWFVVVKAIVSTQKLITYAQSKGASVELAGATFAANERLKKLNEKNARIAFRNISEMQFQIIPSCLDFKITNVEEPRQYGGLNDGLYYVNFNIEVWLNANASLIQELEKQKPRPMTVPEVWGMSYVGKEFFDMIFDRFVIADDINEYLLSCYNRSYDNKLLIKLDMKEKVPNKVRLCNYQTWDLMESWVENGSSIRGQTDVFRINWEEATPNSLIMKQRIELGYTLDDLEKITGINVLLK